MDRDIDVLFSLAVLLGGASIIIFLISYIAQRLRIAKGYRLVETAYEQLILISVLNQNDEVDEARFQAALEDFGYGWQICGCPDLEIGIPVQDLKIQTCEEQLITYLSRLCPYATINRAFTPDDYYVQFLTSKKF